MKTINQDISRLCCKGFPVITKLRDPNGAVSAYGHCAICRKNITVRCTKCMKYLCITADGECRTCWEIFHTEPDLATFTTIQK